MIMMASQSTAPASAAPTPAQSRNTPIPTGNPPPRHRTIPVAVVQLDSPVLTPRRPDSIRPVLLAGKLQPHPTEGSPLETLDSGEGSANRAEHQHKIEYSLVSSSVASSGKHMHEQPAEKGRSCSPAGEPRGEMWTICRRPRRERLSPAVEASPEERKREQIMIRMDLEAQMRRVQRRREELAGRRVEENARKKRVLFRQIMSGQNARKVAAVSCEPRKDHSPTTISEELDELISSPLVSNNTYRKASGAKGAMQSPEKDSLAGTVDDSSKLPSMDAARSQNSPSPFSLVTGRFATAHTTEQSFETAAAKGTETKDNSRETGVTFGHKNPLAQGKPPKPKPSAKSKTQARKVRFSIRRDRADTAGSPSQGRAARAPCPSLLPRSRSERPHANRRGNGRLRSADRIIGS